MVGAHVVPEPREPVQLIVGPSAGRAERKKRSEQRYTPTGTCGSLARWVANRRAGASPRYAFVIELTGGLDTKKKIVARYGPRATLGSRFRPPATYGAHPGATTP